MRVSFEFLYGIWAAVFDSDNSDITFPRCNKDRLIFCDSLNLCPAAPVCFALSEPAKSTRFKCDTYDDELYWGKLFRISTENFIFGVLFPIDSVYLFTLTALPDSSVLSSVLTSNDSMIILNIVCDLDDRSFISVIPTIKYGEWLL